MSLQPFIGNSIAFITTNNCTAKCAHCVMCCTPGQKYMLTFDQMRDTIDQMRAKEELALVVFTGGEPTLLKDDLLRSIRYCNDLGILTRIVTNAHWATDMDRAKEILHALREAGLDEINFSLDDYHAPYVPIEYVRNAWKAARGMGFLSLVIANSHGKNDTITPEFIKEFLGEDIQTRDFDHRHGYSDGREKRDEDGTLYIITEGRLQKTGRANGSVEEDNFHDVINQSDLNCGCRNLLEMPSVSYLNELWACCGSNSDHNEILNLGNLEEDFYEDLMLRASNSVLLNAIRYVGPLALTKYVTQKDPSITFSDNFHSICEICEALTTNARAVEVLRDNMMELTSLIMMREDVEKRDVLLREKTQVKPPLRKLVSRLTSLGYASFYNSLYPMQNSPAKWLALRDKALPGIQPYIDLFLLCKTVRLSALDPEIAEAVRALVCLNLFTIDDEDDDLVHSNNVVLHPVFGIWLFYEVPNDNVSLYFGQDSVALLSRQVPVVGGRSLDLCSGPGIQALYAAKQGEYVTSVEVNLIAADLARINALMNDLDEQIDVRCGDLYNVLRSDECFDRITANPPLLPFPEEIPYVFIGHGGNDGFKVTWRILKGLSTHLSENGTAQIIGFGLGHSGQPLFVDKLKEIAEKTHLDVTVNIVNHISMNRGDAFFNNLSKTSQNYCRLNIEEIEDALEACLQRQNADGYVVFELFCRLGDGCVSVQDLSDGSEKNLWYV